MKLTTYIEECLKDEEFRKYCFEDDVTESDYDDMNDPKEKPITEAQKIFAKNIFDMIQEIIDGEVINEQFTSRSNEKVK